jgi:hypothetical protein
VSDEEREELSDESSEEKGMPADSGGAEEEEPDPRHPDRDPLSGY